MVDQLCEPSSTSFSADRRDAPSREITLLHRRKKKMRGTFRGPASESALQNQKFTTARKKGKPNLRERERERVTTRGPPLVRVRPPLLVIPVVMETPPRRPRAPGHPRTPQTPPSLSRSPRHSPPLFPSTLSLLAASSTPSPLLKPPFARVHQEPVSIRGRVRGPTYSTGSATDNEIVRYHPLAFSPSLFLPFSAFLPVSHAFQTGACFTRFLSDPRFSDLLATVYLSAPLHSPLEIVVRYWISVHFRYLSPFRLGRLARPDSLMRSDLSMKFWLCSMCNCTAVLLHVKSTCVPQLHVTCELLSNYVKELKLTSKFFKSYA